MVVHQLLYNRTETHTHNTLTHVTKAPKVTAYWASSSTKPSPRDIHLQESPVEGEEEGRVGVLGKSLGESHWLAPLLLGGGLSGRSPSREVWM